MMAETVLFEEQTVDGFVLNPYFNLYFTSIDKPFSLVVGEQYQVFWDGNTHICTAEDASAITGGTEMVAIGNGSAFDMSGNNEPFIIATNEDSLMFYVVDPSDSSARHRIGISMAAEESQSSGKIVLKTWDGSEEVHNAPNGISVLLADGSTKKYLPEGEGGVNVAYITFMSHDGAKELYKKPVVVGDDSCDPVTNKLMETPTRESTAEYNFTFAGWATTANGGLDANALKAVKADRKLYANYIATVRTYAVRYFNGDTQVGETQYVAYGGNATSPTVEKEGFQFEGWLPVDTNIVADTDCYAQWRALPAFATATWAEISEVINAGQKDIAFSVGDKRKETITYSDGTTETVEFEIVDMGAAAAVVGGFNIAIMATHALNTPMAYIPSSNVNNAYYLYSNVAPYLKDTILPCLPQEMQDVMLSRPLVTATVNQKIHIPTQKMLTGSVYGGSVNENWQFAAFKSGKSLIYKKTNGTAVSYWNADYYENGSNKYATYINTSGAKSYDIASATNQRHIVLLFFI